MGFTVPSLPSFPSASSVRNLITIDTSPQVFYPSSAANAKPQSTPSKTNIASNSTATASGSRAHTPTRAFPPSPQRHRSTLPPVPNDWPEQVTRGRSRRLSTSSEIQLSPSAGRHLGSPASATGSGSISATATPRAHHRRSQSALPTASHLPRSYNSFTGSAPTPQTSQSASSTPVLGPTTHPEGRLHEFSRNPLCSASAVSLPTLAELELELDGASVQATTKTEGPVPPSPIVRPRDRKDSTASLISITTTSSSLPPSPRRPSRPLRATTELYGGPTSAWSSVPPPQLPSMALGRPRPPPSPRSWAAVIQDGEGPGSIQEEDHGDQVGLDGSSGQAGSMCTYGKVFEDSGHGDGTGASPGIPTSSKRAGVTRHASFSRGRGQLSESAVSPLEVMATWSFPADPNHGVGRDSAAPSINSVTPTSQNAQQAKPPPSGLRDRLRTLSLLDTSASSTRHLRNASTSSPRSAGDMRPPPVPVTVPGGRRIGNVSNNTNAERTQFLPRLSHRHSLSSPNLLFDGVSSSEYGYGVPAPISAAQMQVPRPQPQRRSTNLGSGLRHPNPLGMAKPSIPPSPSGSLACLSSSASSSSSSNNILGLSTGSNTSTTPFPTRSDPIPATSSFPPAEGAERDVNAVPIDRNRLTLSGSSSTTLSSSPGSLLSLSDSTSTSSPAGSITSLPPLPAASLDQSEKREHTGVSEPVGSQQHGLGKLGGGKKWLKGFKWTSTSSLTKAGMQGRADGRAESGLLGLQLAGDMGAEVEIGVGMDMEDMVSSDEEYIDFDGI